MDRQAFRNRMQQLKLYRELNPGKTYLDWKNSLPNNLLDESNYNLRRAYELGYEPEWNEDDKSYHLPTRDSETGEILKKPWHPTFLIGLQEDAKLGYYPLIKNGTMYTTTWEGNENPIYKYADGGEIEDYLILYNDNTRISQGKPIQYRQTRGKVAEENRGYGLTSLLPIVGDALDVMDIKLNIQDKSYLTAGIGAGMLLLPNFIEKPLKFLGKGFKSLLKKEAKTVFNTAEELDDAYLKAVKKGDIKEAQRLRDLHFLLASGLTPEVLYHGAPYGNFNSFDSSAFNATIGGASAKGEKGNFFTDDLPTAVRYSSSKYTDTSKLPVKGHGVNRIPEEYVHGKLLDTHGKNPVLNAKDINEYKRVVYPTYIKQDKIFDTDFKGNFWNEYPEELPSKYHVKRVKDSDIVSQSHYLNKEEAILDYFKDKYPHGQQDVNSIVQEHFDPYSRLREIMKYSGAPEYNKTFFIEEKVPSTTNGVVTHANDRGYDTVIMRNVKDANTPEGKNYPIKDVVSLNSKNIKLADPITYDDAGNIIPLSKRDNFNISDIRYGLIPLGIAGIFNSKNKDNSYVDGGEIPPNNKPIIPEEPQQYKGKLYKDRYGRKYTKEQVNEYYENGTDEIDRFTGKPFIRGLKPVGDIEDAANVTPVGDAISAYGVYNAIKNSDWEGAGLAALGLMPFMSTGNKLFKRSAKASKSRYIPKVDPKYKLNVIDKAVSEQQTFSTMPRDLIEEITEQRNRSYELMLEPYVRNRAKEVDTLYGTDYIKVYDSMLDKYVNIDEYFNLPDPKYKLMERPTIAAQVTPAKGTTMYFNRDIIKKPKDIPDNVVLHEMGHLVDGAAGMNNEFLKRLGDKNKFIPFNQARTMYPEMTQELYNEILLGTEIKSYMNQFRSYLQNKGKLNKGNYTEGHKNLRKEIIEAPKGTFNNIKAIFNLYKSPKLFNKDFNMIPIVSTNSKKDIA